MPRLKLTLAYQGTRYSGWQMQRPARAAGSRRGHPNTIQEELERCLASLVGVRLPVHGAGRTDAGVHAEAQVCHVDIPEDKVRIGWLRALNAELPYDIRVLRADWVPPDFHARKSALRKHYAYTFWFGQAKALPRIQDFVWSVPPLDLSRIEEALPLLTGRHDFASFQNSGTSLANTRRTLFSITCRAGYAVGMRCPPDWPVATLFFCGDGFLKQMVRNLAGMLIWIGCGKLDKAAIPGIIAAKARASLPSVCAQPQGLTLMGVDYDA